MAKTILTGVDNSETALRAAEQAASLAAAFGAELHVLSAFNISMAETMRTVQNASEPSNKSDAYRGIVAQYSQNAEQTASTVADALRINFPDLEITSKGREGTPARAILDEAGEIGADIIVVGNKRVQGPARFLGSIARTVASEAECDLYIVNTHH